jgi:hypothetical protein
MSKLLRQILFWLTVGRINDRARIFIQKSNYLFKTHRGLPRPLEDHRR